MEIDYDFQPVQTKFYAMYEFGTATKLGLGGSRGGTKSATSDIVMLLRRFKYPKTNGLFVMKVYQDMIDIHLTPLFLRYPKLEDNFNKQDMILKFSNGSYIRFLSGDNLKTFQQRKGREFADIVIDQSELFTQGELEFLGTLNRSTDLSITPKMMFCFNPGNVSHTYHKRIFYEKFYEENEHADFYLNSVSSNVSDSAKTSFKPFCSSARFSAGLYWVSPGWLRVWSVPMPNPIV